MGEVTKKGANMPYGSGLNTHLRTSTWLLCADLAPDPSRTDADTASPVARGTNGGCFPTRTSKGYSLLHVLLLRQAERLGIGQSRQRRTIARGDRSKMVLNPTPHAHVPKHDEKADAVLQQRHLRATSSRLGHRPSITPSRSQPLSRANLNGIEL